MCQKIAIVGVLLGCLSGSLYATSPVVINEFMASNSRIMADPQGQYDDWIELFNPTDGPVDVGGMYLTDDLENPTLWRIPVGQTSATTLPARGYLLIWTDEDIEDQGLHGGFKLSANGETIGLFEADGMTLCDSIRFGVQQSDVSQGRFPDWAP